MATANITAERIANIDASIGSIIASPIASDWLKAAIRSSLERDALDAAADAQTLTTLLGDRLDALLGQ